MSGAMTEDRDQVPYVNLVEGFTTEAIDEGDSIVAVFSLLKIRDREGDLLWAGRSGGEPMSSEELLGALSGFVASIQHELEEEWEQ